MYMYSKRADLQHSCWPGTRHRLPPTPFPMPHPIARTHLVIANLVRPFAARPIVHALLAHIEADLEASVALEGHSLLAGQFHGVAHEDRPLATIFEGSVCRGNVNKSVKPPPKRTTYLSMSWEKRLRARMAT